MDTFFEGNYADLLSWCRRHVRPQLGDPEDFVHLAYLRCRQHWSSAQRSVHHGPAYFYRALRWVVADVIRGQQRQPRTTVRMETVPLHAIADIPIRELMARETMDVLTEKERAICLGFLQGRPEKQIRSDLKLSARTLAVHVCRAQSKMRRYLESGAAGAGSAARRHCGNGAVDTPNN